VQDYIWSQDATGLLLREELRKEAERGVASGCSLMIMV